MRAFLCALFILLSSMLSGAFAQNSLPSPPFTQCPAVGVNTGCAILIVIDSNGSLRVATDPKQGPYDNSDDTLIGVQNNSTQVINSIPLKSSNPIFGFEGDGICATDSNGRLLFNPAPPNCPTGGTGYEGPGVTFSNVSTDTTSGTVNFIGGIAPGKSAYFSLEGAIQTQCQPLTVQKDSQADSQWATDTYDHLYTSKPFKDATATAVSSTGTLELAVFAAGATQGSPATTVYPIALPPANNNLNGLRDAINKLSVAGVSASVGLNSKKLSVLTLVGTAVGTMQLRSTPGVATSNLLTNIKAQGCFLTSTAMIINYQASKISSAFRTNPQKLNDYLNSIPTGYIAGNVNGTEAAKYANMNGVPMSYAGIGSKKEQRDDFLLDNYICSGQPVMLKVGTPNGPHFVVATGQTTANGVDSYLINDPGYSFIDLSGYGNTYSGLRLYKAQSASLAALYVYAHSPVELVLTDAAGRKTGFDPRTGSAFNDIPSSGYDATSIGDDENPDVADPSPEVKDLEVMTPVAGKYQLEAIGTGNGPFTLDFIAYDQAGNASVKTFQGTAITGAVAAYAIDYSPVVGAMIQVQPAGDTTPPTITGMPTNICNIWPPNKKLVQVATVGATDNGSGVASLDVSVVSSEPGTGTQFTITTDALGNKVVSLLADRTGNGPGRTYTITAVAKDRNGNISQAAATCTVPHDQGQKK